MDLKKQKRSVNFMLTVTYVVILLRAVPIHLAIGDTGFGIFAAAYVLFFLYDYFTREIFSGNLAKLMNAKVKREQYQDAEQAFDLAMFLSLAVGIFVTAVVFLSAPMLAGKLLGIPQTEKVLRYLAPAFCFATVSSSFSAYLKGMGEHINDSIVRLGTELLVTLLCIVMSGVMYRQGEAVGTLLKQDVFAGIYGAQGCALAVSIATFLCMLIYFFLYLQMKVSMKRRVIKDTQSRYEPDAVYAQYLYISSAVHYLNHMLLPLCVLVEERVFVSKLNGAAMTECVIANAWGVYAGTVLPFLLLPAAAACIHARGTWNTYKRALARDERKFVRDTIQSKIRRFCLVYAPLAMFVMVFASPLLGFLYGEQGKPWAGALSAGAPSIFLLGFGVALMQVLLGLEKPLYILAIHAAGFVIHLIVLEISVKPGRVYDVGLGFAWLAASAVMAVAYGFVVSMQLNYRHNVLNIAKPLISAAGGGLVGLIVVKLAGASLGNMLTLIIGGVLFFIVYLILMIFLRGLTRKEISQIPGGEFIMRMLS
ncbi:MAG: polysaccharide biosynthesis C-terminal domain-containing protein [bacterium]|nr:polysaccharide biosynthesis C-terminal domain-containing protein [bacterium]